MPMTETKAERNKLVENNLGLVHSCANRFRGRGAEYDDLFQAGCVGLIKAADNFDESRGFSFSTYAVPVILGEIKRIFRDGGTVKVGRAIKEKSRLVLKRKEEISVALGREPTVSELADSLKIDVTETYNRRIPLLVGSGVYYASNTSNNFSVPFRNESLDFGKRQSMILIGIKTITDIIGHLWHKLSVTCIQGNWEFYELLQILPCRH